MRNALLALALILPLTTGAADRIALVNPAPSVLQPTQVRTKDGHSAKFVGQIQIDGTLYVEWYGGSPPAAEYRLIPSPKSAKQLPHFRGYGVTWIEPLDGPETLRSAVDSATFQRVIAKQSSFRVSGSWFVTEYEVGIECDAPYAHAKVWAAPAPQKLAVVEKPETC